MKARILILAFVVPLIIALAGCGNSGTEGQANTVQPNEPVSATKDAKSGNSASTIEPTVSE
jgi:hypothetical protein